MAGRNDDYDRWIYSNEAADVTAGALADQQGTHDKELCTEEFNV